MHVVTSDLTYDMPSDPEVLQSISMLLYHHHTLINFRNFSLPEKKNRDVVLIGVTNLIGTLNFRAYKRRKEKWCVLGF